jgi:hypothetical protein
MSIYQTFNPNLSNYETPDPNIISSGFGPSLNERDIDKEIVYTEGGQNYYDYDVTSNPTVSGVNVAVPIQSSSILGSDDFIMGDSSDSLGSQIDIVNNGRVGDISVTNESTKKPDDMFINKDNKVNSIKGIVESTSLNDIFFSDMNTDIIQKTIRYKVFENTDKVISDQSSNTIFIIMRSIMLQYGNFQISSENLYEEIKELNKKVVDYCSDNITSNLQQYLGYIKDIEKLPTPIDRPVYHNKENFTYDISNLL